MSQIVSENARQVRENNSYPLGTEPRTLTFGEDPATFGAAAIVEQHPDYRL